MANRTKHGTSTRAWSLALTVTLGIAAGCSSGGQGSLVGCVAPGAACCSGNACATGLTCEQGVCVEVEGGGNDAATGDAAQIGDGASYETGSAADAGVDLGALHQSCTNGACPAGLMPVSYTGIAGPGGPTFCSCEIPCAGDASACPAGTTCGFMADGPGYVCSN